MKKIIIITFVFCFLRCKENKEEHELIAKPNIVQILDSFVKQGNCDDCIYELYIDKKSPQLSELIVYKGKYSLMERTGSKIVQPVIYFKTSKGVKVWVYSGSEDYFSSREAVKSNHASVIENTDDYKIWVIKDSVGIFTKKEVRFAYPFMSFPKDKVSFGKR